MDNSQDKKPENKKRWNPKKSWKPWEKSKALRDMKTLIALLNSPTVKAAYAKLHPNASEATAEACGSKLVTQEILDKIRIMLSIDPKIKTTRMTIERFLYYILGQYMSKQIRPAEAMRALELLSKLVPDFKERHEIDDLSQLSKEELDTRLTNLGFRYGDLKNDVSRN